MLLEAARLGGPAESKLRLPPAGLKATTRPAHAIMTTSPAWAAPTASRTRQPVHANGTGTTRCRASFHPVNYT